MSDATDSFRARVVAVRAESASRINATTASQALDLDREQAIVDAATPGPWYPRYLDDDRCMNLIAVSTEPDTGQHEKYWEADEGAFIGVLLAQQGFGAQGGANISHDSDLWSENAMFIARARTLVPLLIARVRELEERVAAKGVANG